MASKIKRVTSKADVEEVISEEVKASEVSLDEYIKNHRPHYGLVVSFKYEATKTENGLADRTEAEWKQGFEEQSSKTYK